MNNKKHRQYTRLLDLVKQDESNKNSIQAQEKAGKFWNDVQGNPSDYLELVAKTSKNNLFKKVEKCCLEKLCQKKTKKTTQYQSNGKMNKETII